MKKKALFLILIVVFVSILSGCNDEDKADSFGPSSWKQYRFNTSNNAVFSNDDSREITQTYKTDDEVRTNPVVVGDNLYVGTHNSGILYSFDVFSGEENWHQELPNWIHEDAIYADDTVFVGYGNRMFEDALHPDIRGTGESGVAAFDAETGEEVWQYETPGEVMPAPAYKDGKLYFATGDSKLYAVNAETGELDWDLDLPGWVSMSAPHIENNILYVGALDNLVAVDLEQRQINWQEGELGSVTDVPPAISDDGVVIVTGAKMNPTLSKDELYEKYGEDMPNLTFTVTEKEKEKYGDDQDNYHFIYAFNAETGELLWKDLMGTGPDQDVPIPHTNTSGAVTIKDDVAFVGSPYTKSMMAYQISNGEKIWETETDTPFIGAPALKDDFVYFGDAEGTLYKVNTVDGEIVSMDDLGGALAPGGPIIINDTLFIGSQDHNVYTQTLE